MPDIHSYKSYFNHRFKAKNRHGIHSPFVYRLLDEVIYFKGHYYNYDKVNALRTKLLRNNTAIQITDLGAGSKTLKSERKLSQIMKTSVKSKKLGELIYRLAVNQQANTVLELGTSLGITTMYLALANTNSQIITIEGDPSIRKYAIENFSTLGIQNIRSLEGNFDNLLPELLPEINTLDLVFLDGNHRKIPTLNYIESIRNKMSSGGLIIVDDIYWSKEMTEAWNEIIRIPEFTVTIDLFYFGLVFIRPEQVKEHFFIKI